MSLDASRWAWKQRLKATDKIVLLAMADRAGEDHKCYPSIARLVYDTGLNRKTVVAVLGRLRELGVIGKTGRMVGSNMGVPEYQLLGVSGREDEALGASPKNGHSPKVDTAQKRAGGQTQKRDYHQSQKRDTESTIEPTNESSSNYCAEFEPNSTPPVPQVVICTLPLNDGSDFDVTQDFVAELAPLYPNVDVVQALRSMKGWLIGNAQKRKTRRGIKAFITSWLSREQDKPRAAAPTYGQGQAPQPRSYRDCVDLEQRQENELLSQLQEQLDGKRDSGAHSLGAGQAQSAITSN